MISKFVQEKVIGVYREYPGAFWTLFMATFVDRLGAALIFPFFSLYVTDKFNVDMTEVGILFFIFATTGVVGSFVGGAMTDKFGRKAMVIFGLLVSAFSSLAMGLVADLNLFYVLGAVVGLFSNTGGPAQQAMVADLLPEEKRADGFGLIRVIANLAITIGPVIGGFLANRSYLLLFILDAISSTIAAVIVFLVLPETKPKVSEEAAEENIVQTLRGYGKVARDGLFMAFLGASTLMILVYMQMNSTLSVFLRDVHGVPPSGFGWIMSMNAGMVVVLQFWITRRITRYPPMLVMVAGTLLYAVGFGMYGFVSAMWLFFLAMIVITVGEMFVVPVGQALVACFAPEDMRGRYMAMFGFSWAIPSAIGPYLAGLIMDNGDPNWVWYAGGIVALLAAGGYYSLHVAAEECFCEMEIPGAEPAAEPAALAD